MRDNIYVNVFMWWLFMFSLYSLLPCRSSLLRGPAISAYLYWFHQNRVAWEQQVELSFKTGEVILVYGDMDEDGFFMGELDGVRGLVPSNFLTEAPEQYNNAVGGGPSGAQQRNVAGGGVAGGGGGIGTGVGGAVGANRGGAGGRVPGPGARGPPPPPRDGMMAGPNGGQIGVGVGPMGQMGQMGGAGPLNQLNQQQQQQRGGPAGLRKGNLFPFRLYDQLDLILSFVYICL